MKKVNDEYTVIEFKKEDKEYIDEFLKLPKKLYSKKEIMQNEEEERQILEKKHILSKYFKIHRFLLIDKNGKALARAIVTFYENDENAYIGYYECVEDINVSNFLLEHLERFIAFNGYKKIIGPYNCSFWIGYRFKTNNFGRPYTGEPYNKPYYPRFFENAGYEISNEYSSNQFSKISKYQRNDTFTYRLKELQDKGYEFVEPTEESFDSQLRLIGNMILDLYSTFPSYKPIDSEDFYELYKDLKKIVDYSMIKLAYYDGEMVGFFVSIPNYSNAINRKNYLKILKNKIVTKEYILMYLGVKKEHLGLGRALAESMKNELKHNGATSIGALIKKGNANKAYFKELITKEYNYVLYSKKIN